MPRKRATFNQCRKRYLWICFLVVLVGGLTMLRYGWLQLVRGQELIKYNQNMVQGQQVEHHPRGKIVDRNGAELAVSVMSGSLYADPVGMVDEDSSNRKGAVPRNVPALAAKLLAEPLHMQEADLLEIFTMPERRFMWVKRMLDAPTEKTVRRIIRDNKLPGLHFQLESRRYYTKKKAAAHVLGFVGLDDEGRYGVELNLDKELKGRITKQLQSFNSRQQRIYDDNVKDPVEVKLPTAYLTLDSPMQFVLEEAIDNAVAEYNADGAAAIIMDPYTGEILAMTSRPTFDPNEYDEYPMENWSNKGVSFIYEPGSVFKPIVGSIGLTKGVVAPSTVFHDKGSIKVADRVFHNWDGEGLGYISFTDVIKFSNNVGMIQLGQMIGKKSMVEGAKSFGFGKATGVDLPGEESGILYGADMWDPDLASFSIGQGIAVTPLQELRAICSIANGGELLKPYIIKKIVDADGNVIREGKKELIRRAITEDVAAQMRGMMEKVVSEGGGKKASIKGYRIAGKTGTAEKLDPNGGYTPGKYIASFVGFVPADKPKYAMLVMVDTPRGSRFYGSQVSAPIFRDVLQQILVLKGIQPSSSEGLLSMDDMQRRSEALRARLRQRPLPKLQSLPNGKIKLPSFNGIDIRKATELLTAGKLRLRPHGEGTAYQQKPAPGTEVAPNTVVEIWFN